MQMLGGLPEKFQISIPLVQLVHLKNVHLQKQKTLPQRGFKRFQQAAHIQAKCRHIDNGQCHSVTLPVPYPSIDGIQVQFCLLGPLLPEVRILQRYVCAVTSCNKAGLQTEMFTAPSTLSELHTQ